MKNFDRIRQSIYRAIDELNQQLPEQLAKSENTILFGRDGKLDSLGIVSLLVMTEQQLEEEFGTSIVLADERAMSQKNSPFKTIESLINYIAFLLEEQANVREANYDDYRYEKRNR